MPEFLERLEHVLGEGFRVERELGGGGMSRVFLVHDDSLDRQIVVKVLPPELAAELSTERFKREILLAARLQHPHIVPLLTAGAREGLLYYVMPFIDGESLRARLARHHELPVGEVTRILRDVADALAFAHANGVVHRDIKPDNVLMAGHHALVTDFGVSRALSNAGDVTITSVGMALGTPAYMSPEQAVADPLVDHRADIYSVGALGYELLTGRQPFSGMTPQQVLAAHISVTPEHVSVHRATVPPALAAVIMKCLEKRPGDRWQSADELVAQLEAIATPSGSMQPSAAIRVPARPLNRRLIAGVVTVALLLAIVGWWMTRPLPVYSVGSTAQITNAPGLELDASISPDGRLLAYSSGSAGRTQVFVRQVTGGTARALTDGAPGGQRTPRWSADGQSITFLVGQSLYRAPALGGAPELLIDGGDYEFANPALSPDGKSVAWADQKAVHVRLLAGGPDRKVAETSYPNYLVWSPDGRRLAFVSDNAWFIYGRNNLGNLAPSSVWVVALEGGTPIRVSNATHLNTSPVWTPDGQSILFVSSLGGSRDVYEQRLSGSGRPRGAPIRLTTGLNAHTISLSRDGSRLAYSVLTTRSNLWWAPISRSGVTPFAAATPVTNENQTVEGMGISPDGEWLVYDSSRGGAQAIFKIRVEGGEPIQLTRDSADVFLPSWSPDGREVAYHSWQAGNRDVYVVGADGRAPRAATSDPGHEMYPIWSPSGRELLFISDRNRRWELYVISRNADGSWNESKQITSNFGYNGRWSPDGKHVAYVSLIDTTIHVMNADGSGSRLLFDGHALGLTTPQVAFGRRPDVLYFHAVDRDSRHAFYEIPLGGGAPRLVFRFPELGPQPRRTEFDTDGRRLFFTVATDESDVWLMDLQRR
jgi:Tol biopolymer transport system component/serine/threonine protein kinase